MPSQLLGNLLIICLPLEGLKFDRPQKSDLNIKSLFLNSNS